MPEKKPIKPDKTNKVSRSKSEKNVPMSAKSARNANTSKKSNLSKSDLAKLEENLTSSFQDAISATQSKDTPKAEKPVSHIKKPSKTDKIVDKFFKKVGKGERKVKSGGVIKLAESETSGRKNKTTVKALKQVVRETGFAKKVSKEELAAAKTQIKVAEKEIAAEERAEKRIAFFESVGSAVERSVDTVTDTASEILGDSPLVKGLTDFVGNNAKRIKDAIKARAEKKKEFKEEKQRLKEQLAKEEEAEAKEDEREKDRKDREDKRDKDREVKADARQDKTENNEEVRHSETTEGLASIQDAIAMLAFEPTDQERQEILADEGYPDMQADINELRDVLAGNTEAIENQTDSIEAGKEVDTFDTFKEESKEQDVMKDEDSKWSDRLKKLGGKSDKKDVIKKKGGGLFGFGDIGRIIGGVLAGGGITAIVGALAPLLAGAGSFIGIAAGITALAGALTALTIIHWDKVGPVFKAFGDAIRLVSEHGLYGGLAAFGIKYSDEINAVVAKFENMWDSFLGNLEEAWDSMLATFDDIWNPILDKVRSVFGIISGIEEDEEGNVRVNPVDRASGARVLVEARDAQQRRREEERKQGLVDLLLNEQELSADDLRALYRTKFRQREDAANLIGARTYSDLTFSNLPEGTEFSGRATTLEGDPINWGRGTSVAEELTEQMADLAYVIQYKYDMDNAPVITAPVMPTERTAGQKIPHLQELFPQAGKAGSSDWLAQHVINNPNTAKEMLMKGGLTEALSGAILGMNIQDTGDLSRMISMAMAESSGGKNLHNLGMESTAGGAWQFVQKTWLHAVEGLTDAVDRDKAKESMSIGDIRDKLGIDLSKNKVYKSWAANEGVDIDDYMVKGWRRFSKDPENLELQAKVQRLHSEGLERNFMGRYGRLPHVVESYIMHHQGWGGAKAVFDQMYGTDGVEQVPLSEIDLHTPDGNLKTLDDLLNFMDAKRDSLTYDIPEGYEMPIVEQSMPVEQQAIEPAESTDDRAATLHGNLLRETLENAETDAPAMAMNNVIAPSTSDNRVTSVQNETTIPNRSTYHMRGTQTRMGMETVGFS